MLSVIVLVFAMTFVCYFHIVTLNFLNLVRNICSFNSGSTGSLEYLQVVILHSKVLWHNKKKYFCSSIRVFDFWLKMSQIKVIFISRLTGGYVCTNAIKVFSFIPHTTKFITFRSFYLVHKFHSDFRQTDKRNKKIQLKNINQCLCYVMLWIWSSS